jgi:hypothetical protein
MAAGHVYILVNASIQGHLKIGMTERTPEERARELSQGSGVPAPFTVAYFEHVPDCADAERLIHLRLDKYRTNQNREFFHLPLQDAIRELAQIANEVRRSAPPVVQSPTAPRPTNASPRRRELRSQQSWQHMVGLWWMWEAYFVTVYPGKMPGVRPVRAGVGRILT